MTSVLRAMMEVAPLHLIDKPAPGTGGSYLIDIAAAIALGSRAPVIAWSPSAEENEKRLISAALAQQSLIAIDNVSGTLASDFLCQLTERPLLTCRPLGRSEVIKVPNSAMVTANGNNIEISADEVRRTIRIGLDANVENPDDRTFTRDPLGDVLADRGTYIAAVLTIARAYVAAGGPGRLLRPSYELWSEVVRSSLIWLGEADPVLSVSQVRAQDPVAAQRAAVFDAWARELVIGQGYMVRELVEAADKRDPRAGMTGYAHPDLRDSLFAVAQARGTFPVISPDRLGRWLRRNADGVTSGFKLTVDYSDKARPRFAVTRAP
jgi:putative DNA primase/helicase